jgi:hypothetical protein
MITLARIVRWVGATIASAVVLVAVARTSAAPVAYHGGEDAVLRLSWSARPERIETCRTISKEELEREEEHMRQRVECDGTFASYVLRVESDQQLVSESIVRGAGFRHDRPIYLLREWPVSSGAHRVRVSFARREQPRDRNPTTTTQRRLDSDTGIFAGRAEREEEERSRRRRAAIPSLLVLDTTFVFEPRRVVLVTLNAERRVLEVATSGR